MGIMQKARAYHYARNDGAGSPVRMVWQHLQSVHSTEGNKCVVCDGHFKSQSVEKYSKPESETVRVHLKRKLNISTNVIPKSCAARWQH